MTHRTCLVFLAATFAGTCSLFFAQSGPENEKPDARFGNWLFRTPDARIWKRTEKNGALIYSVDSPPGDFCTLTLFADVRAQADVAQQFNAAIAADQKAKDTVKIEADSGLKAHKGPTGYDLLTRNLRSETSALHTFHAYIGVRSGDLFGLIAFQTTNDAAWKQYGGQAGQFVRSLKPANSLPPDELAKLIGSNQPNAVLPPTLPGFDDAPTAATANSPVAAKGPATSVTAAAPTNIPELPLEKSAIVANGAVAQKDGQPIDGIKLSQHDKEIGSPSIAVAPDGTIHIAFVEKQRTPPYPYAIYHRSSSDGGKTWTEAKNLSEEMVGVGVGRCYVLVDPRNRTYVIWRAGLSEGFLADLPPHGGHPCNLWFRELEDGKWSKAKLISHGADANHQRDGTLSYFATIDAAGRPQVIWNSLPDKWHPELARKASIGSGLVFQATLDGANVGTPREIFLAPIGNDTKNGYGLNCDTLDTLNGYVDSTGGAHFVASAKNRVTEVRGKSRYKIIEDGKVDQVIDLPELSFHAWSDIPTLLIDAKGQRHVIAMFLGGERQHIRDYLIGSDDEPVVIRAASAVTGKIEGFQAFQGPGGRMVVIMQFNDTGDRASGETYVSVNKGDGWSKPINVTNNEGRRRFHSTQTTSRSNVAVASSYYPGPAAAAFDRGGHLLLLMINNEYGAFGSYALGVELAAGSSVTPTLQFLRF